MEKRLMTFIAGVALSMGSALAQTSISGTVVSNEDEDQLLVLLFALMELKRAL